jgi:hypothetical protein
VWFVLIECDISYRKPKPTRDLGHEKNAFLLLYLELGPREVSDISYFSCALSVHGVPAEASE